METQAETHKAIPVNIIHYRYEWSDQEEQGESYSELVRRLSGYGYKCFSTRPKVSHFKTIAPIQHIEPALLFDNQYNTEEGNRVFDWFEAIYDNKGIHEGYYIEPSEALKRAKEDQYRCGYCGARFHVDDAPIFCDKCLGSEYLKEGDLSLLALQPIAGPRRDHEATPELRAAYTAAQAEAVKTRRALRQVAREKKALRLIEESRIKTLELAEETRCKVEALRAGLDVDNLIHYGPCAGGKGWVWGWNKGVSRAFSEQIRSADLSFDYTIKHDDGTQA